MSIIYSLLLLTATGENGRLTFYVWTPLEEMIYLRLILFKHNLLSFFGVLPIVSDNCSWEISIGLLCIWDEKANF